VRSASHVAFKRPREWGANAVYVAGAETCNEMTLCGRQEERCGVRCAGRNRYAGKRWRETVVKVTWMVFWTATGALENEVSTGAPVSGSECISTLMKEDTKMHS